MQWERTSLCRKSKLRPRAVSRTHPSRTRRIAWRTFEQFRQRFFFSPLLNAAVFQNDEFAIRYLEVIFYPVPN